LSAVEGLSAVTPALTPYVVPASLLLLALLFLIQRKGTGSISTLFGPVMLLWFVCLGLLGLYGIVRNPVILQALNPYFAIRFVAQNGTAAFFIFGSIFLAVTGAEMLYTDIGHFGKSSIRVAWLSVAFPTLILNYLGQSAMLMVSPPGSNSSMFYNLCPPELLIPMIVLATAATIIASQAVISGMFSLARQAIQLDYWPRLRQVHTSKLKAGQVYVPFVNFMLFLGTVSLVLFFKKSERLASAYGIAVSADMIITTSLITYLSWKRWKRGRVFAICFALLYIPIDLGFFSANIAKVATGGWVVVAISIILHVIMSTWRKGRQVLQKNVEGQSLATDLFIHSVQNDKPLRVPGIAVFLTGNKAGTPRSLLHNFKHNKIIHETVIIVTIVFEEVPYVEAENRYQYENLGAGIHRLDLHYGFFESPDVPASLKSIPMPGIEFKPMQVTYFLGRESLVVTGMRSMARWRKRIFRFLSMNAVDASEYFQLPSNRVVEVGLQVEM
jgi:KUP system potassium uptake protein